MMHRKSRRLVTKEECEKKFERNVVEASKECLHYNPSYPEEILG